MLRHVLGLRLREALWSARGNDQREAAATIAQSTPSTTKYSASPSRISAGMVAASATAAAPASWAPPMAESAMNRPGAPGSGATPEEVQRWWESLSEAEREAVIAAYPERIGQGDGLPAGARDQANDEGAISEIISYVQRQNWKREPDNQKAGQNRHHDWPKRGKNGRR